jgi:hypothetical protein
MTPFRRSEASGTIRIVFDETGAALLQMMCAHLTKMALTVSVNVHASLASEPFAKFTKSPAEIPNPSKSE